jgi:hypothetical protein
MQWLAATEQQIAALVYTTHVLTLVGAECVASEALAVKDVGVLG